MSGKVTKKARKGLLATTAFGVQLLHGGFALAQPLPTGGQVVGGQVGISQAGNTMTIDQATQRGAINWQSFDIGAGNAVQFNQPNAQAMMGGTLNVAGPSSANVIGWANGGGNGIDITGQAVANANVMATNGGNVTITGHSPGGNGVDIANGAVVVSLGAGSKVNITGTTEVVGGIGVNSLAQVIAQGGGTANLTGIVTSPAPLFAPARAMAAMLTGPDFVPPPVPNGTVPPDTNVAGPADPGPNVTVPPDTNVAGPTDPGPNVTAPPDTNVAGPTDPGPNVTAPPDTNVAGPTEPGPNATVPPNSNVAGPTNPGPNVTVPPDTNVTGPAEPAPNVTVPPDTNVAGPVDPGPNITIPPNTNPGSGSTPARSSGGGGGGGSGLALGIGVAAGGWWLMGSTSWNLDEPQALAVDGEPGLWDGAVLESVQLSDDRDEAVVRLRTRTGVYQHKLALRDAGDGVRHFAASDSQTQLYAELSFDPRTHEYFYKEMGVRSAAPYTTQAHGWLTAK